MPATEAPALADRAGQPGRGPGPKPGTIGRGPGAGRARLTGGSGRDPSSVGESSEVSWADTSLRSVSRGP
jgi:hypothetical protein